MACGSNGRCAFFLVAALLVDVVGLAMILAGAVGQPALDGQGYGDFLVLSGALLLFFSLLLWLFWYSGNLRGVVDEELPPGARPSAPRRSRLRLVRLTAKFSERLSQRRRPAPAPSLPSRAATAAGGTTASFRPASPLELGHLRSAARSEHSTPNERLV